ncbi:hypothetical protein CTB91_01410 [Dickeya solani]|uniref:Transposase n=1 Tax=Dickeya solani D s0432-1 TaxID=1231725 RepID=A0AAV3KBT3_9GAMM|nr:hypothetical protein D083_4031 [Dickeya solani RNS 08.23.3.1.A]AYQ47226.1 hypothetical protein CTB91_01410 [Dickeya solani]ERO58208.1 hypothetical protein A544_1383 [Dickeya solani D s0432-1]AYQ51398.1 hypothetical protein DSOL99_01416 [Dickeya solani]MBD3607281.1 hypothetical protein [Dickeya solani]
MADEWSALKRGGCLYEALMQSQWLESMHDGTVTGFFTELRVLSQIYYSLSPMW